MRGHWSSPDYRRDNDANHDMRRNENAEQGVPVYDPQLVARHGLRLAASVYSTARGSCLNPDVQIDNAAYK